MGRIFAWTACPGLCDGPHMAKKDRLGRVIHERYMPILHQATAVSLAWHISTVLRGVSFQATDIRK
jgi:hypothetical protein